MFVKININKWHIRKHTNLITTFRGSNSAMDSIPALHPAAPGSIPGVPKNFSDLLMLPRLIDSAVT